MRLRTLTRVSLVGSIVGLGLILSIVGYTWSALDSDLDEMDRLLDIQDRAAELNIAADQLMVLRNSPAVVEGIRAQLSHLKSRLNAIDHPAARPARLHLKEIEHIILAISELRREAGRASETRLALDTAATQIGTHQSGLTGAVRAILSDRKASVNRSLQRSLGTLAVMAVILAGLSLVGFMVMHRRIDRPVIALEDAIRRSREGDLEARVELSTQDELGELAQSFNRMTEVRQRHEQQIASYHSDLERSLEQLRNLAYRDRLTGALSREGFIAELKAVQEGSGGVQGYVVAFDIVGMHDINETHGYTHADQLLCDIRARVKKWLGAQSLLARVGGDEFAFHWFDMGDGRSTEAFADSLRGLFEAPFYPDGLETHVEVAFGVVEAGSTPETDLRRAEIALFSIRRDRMRQWEKFTPEMEKRTHERLRTTRSLQNAIKNNEFSLRYQPQVDLASGHITGGEALIRWDHPSYGTQSPGQFVPVAEQSKLIIPIGEWALRQACRQMKEWRAANLPVVRIAVNVSLVQFLTSDFASTVRSILQETGTQSRELSLEVTESIFDQQSPQFARQIHRLDELGVKLLLDDFGTGYSSLRYLREYPFSTIKLDRSFVSQIQNDRYSRAICEMVIRIGAELGAEIVAEGIETQAQRELLMELGCRTGQGFLFCQPLVTEEFRELLESGETLGPKERLAPGDGSAE